MSTSYRTAIDADVRAVLERSVITAVSVALPDEQLERGLYQRVNKVLVAAGGTWDRRAGAHLFSRDPSEQLGLALENGSIQDERRAKQQFFTPDWLAVRMCQEAHVGPGDRVLEPSAGAGAIAQAAYDRGATVVCIELDRTLVDQLVAIRDDPRWIISHHDFLAVQHFVISEGYDAVLMNPPFANGQVVRHVSHAMRFVRPDGFLIAIAPPPAASKVLALPEIIGWVARIEALPDDTFKEAGTGVRASLLVLWRRV